MKTAEDAEGKRLDEITGAVVDAAMRIHMALGPGLLSASSVYSAVFIELFASGRSASERGFRPILTKAGER
jgi:hypothetical protein